jgi:glycerol-3-phosphate dehydrogenase (NAD(P)+)
LGGGSWGTALAVHLLRAGHEVRLWLRDAEVARQINTSHLHPRYLRGLPLPETLHATTDLASALAAVDSALLVVPSAATRALGRAVAAWLPAAASVVSTAKGIELGSLARMSQVLAEELPGRPLAVLSGPSFALEVAQGKPTAVVVASAEAGLAERLQQALSSRSFRVYASDDVLGVELVGALKNVMAIAAGILDGLELGQNTAAALITRGLAEMGRLVGAMGGRADTVAGLAGLGDLVLTCTGGLSRNRQVGQALGRGANLEQALRATGMVAEGVGAAQAACALAERAGIEMPIVQQMRAVLYDGKPPAEVVEELMLRRLKRE